MTARRPALRPEGGPAFITSAMPNGRHGGGFLALCRTGASLRLSLVGEDGCDSLGHFANAVDAWLAIDEVDKAPPDLEPPNRQAT